MTEYLFARVTDVDASSAIAASVAAAISAGEAATSEGNAATSETNAAASEAAADVSETNAAASAVAAAASADAFDDVYLGTKAADPTLDNDGNALVTGQMYFNSGTNSLRIYNGASWLNYTAATGIANVVEDTSPELGGSLDGGGFDITNIDDATFDTLTVTDLAYDATTWNASNLVPTRNAVRDKIEALDAAKQNVDASLTAYAALVTAADKAVYYTGADVPVTFDFTSVARTLVAQTTQALMRTTGLGFSANASSFVAAADYAAMRTALGVAIGSDVQAYDADLASWAGVTRAANFDTFVTTPSSANLRALLTDETGSALLYFQGGALGTPSGGTLSSCDVGTTSARGVLELALASEIWTGTSTSLVPAIDQMWAAGAVVGLTDAATIAVDFGTLINASVTLGGNRTLGNPTNATKVGQSGFIAITQDASAPRTLAYGTNWEFVGGTAPVLSVTNGAKDLLFYVIQSSTSIIVTGLLKNVS